jgi:hypothetical protein
VLIDFISDYLRQPAVRQRASQNPIEVLSEYGVSPEAQQALRHHDQAKILEIAQAELTGLFAQRSDGGSPVMLWGPINIQVTSVDPSTTTVKTSTPLTIEGMSFPTKEEARLSFTPEKPGKPAVHGRVLSVTTKPDGYSTLKGEVTLPTAGSWKVAVADASNPGAAGVWPGDFVVTSR